jgi:hypothetical protein
MKTGIVGSLCPPNLQCIKVKVILAINVNVLRLSPGTVAQAPPAGFVYELDCFYCYFLITIGKFPTHYHAMVWPICQA